MRNLFLVLCLVGVPALGWAGDAANTCPYAEPPDSAVAWVASIAPAHIGGHSSYGTTAMIRRVLRKGNDWTLEGTLRRASPLAHDVAAPYTVGPESTRVLANIVLDRVAASSNEPGMVLRMTGKRLVHQGVAYVVLVEASPIAP